MVDLVRIILLGLCSPAWVLALSIDDLVLGTPVSGPTVSKDDLKGRVVVFEYWGVNCPPCLDNIPHVSALAGVADRDQLVVIANHCQRPGRTAEVWRKHGGSDAVAVVDEGSLQGVEVRSIPRLFVFDHTGAQVFSGHPARFPKERLERLVEAMPSPLAPSGSFPTCLKELAVLRKSEAPAASALKSLRSRRDAGKEPAASEAKAVLAAVATAAETRLKRCQADLATRPYEAYQGIVQLAAQLRGDPLGVASADLLQQLKSDKSLQREVKAGGILDQLRTAGRNLGAGSDDLPANKRVALRELREQLAMLNQKYPDTKAGPEALKLIEQWSESAER